MSKPEKVFKSGSVSASLWPRTANVHGGSATFYSVKIEKTYKDGDEWKHCNVFSAEDLPKVRLVANEAYRFIALKERAPKPTPEGAIRNQENSQ